MRLIKLFLNKLRRTLRADARPTDGLKGARALPHQLSIGLLITIALTVFGASRIIAQNNANTNANANRNVNSNSGAVTNNNQNPPSSPSPNPNPNGGTTPPVKPKCPPDPNALAPEVTAVYKDPPVQNGKKKEERTAVAPEQVNDVTEQEKLAKDVELGDVIVVEVENLPTLIAQGECSTPKKPIVLYLNDRPIKDAVAYPPTDPKKSFLKFPLKRTEASREVWTDVLGSAQFAPRPTKVSVGLVDQHAIESDQTMNLKIIPTGWFLFWAALFLLLLIGFAILAKRSDLLRDAAPVPGGGERRPYSLARSQAAFWFFLVLVSYLFIGIITGDFGTTITTTVLSLLGISAGTVVGAAFVDAGKATAEDAQKQAAAAAALQTQLPSIDADIAKLNADKGEVQAKETEIKTQKANLETNLNTTPADTPKLSQVNETQTELAVAQTHMANIEKELASKKAEKETKLSQLKKLNNQSESFLLDILSDATGVSFHRFQIVAWTIVLGFIFVFQVYKVLAMPVFNASLLTLLGISAGTYIGLKIPEKTVPK